MHIISPPHTQSIRCNESNEINKIVHHRWDTRTFWCMFICVCRLISAGFQQSCFPSCLTYLRQATQHIGKDPKGVTKTYYAVEMFVENLGEERNSNIKVLKKMFCRAASLFTIWRYTNISTCNSVLLCFWLSISFALDVYDGPISSPISVGFSNNLC